MKTKIALWLSFCLLLLTSSSVRAQTAGISLSLTPPLVEVLVQPGKSLEQSFIVGNAGSPTTLKINLAPLVAEDLYGNVKLGQNLSDFDPQSFSSWFTFLKPRMKAGGSLFLPSGKEREVRLKITPPEDAVEGDYYFGLTFETSPEGEITSGNAVAKAKIGANLLLTVSSDGQPSKSARISRFEAPAILDSLVPLTYEVEIENTGQTVFKPLGRITVKNILGQTEILTLAPQNILASSKRIIPCIQAEQLIRCSLKNKLPFGLYRATLSFSPDGGSQIYKQEAITLVLPSALILALTAIGLITYSVMKKLRKRL